jgi:hypothetical protein
MPKKDVTYLLDRNTNKFYEHVSFTYDNFQVDKNGLLLSYALLYKTTDVNNTSNAITTFNYSDCN